MEYILDVKLNDENFCSIIHLVTTIKVKTENEAKLMLNELMDGFSRKSLTLLQGSYFRIDHDASFRERQYEYYNFCASRATASFLIEQFIIEDPDQNLSLYDNLTTKLFNGESSMAQIGKKFNVPVRVMEKGTQTPIKADFFYHTIEHIIPKE